MIIKNLKRIIRTLFYLVIFAVLIIAGYYVGINMYKDLKGNEAKKYLIEKYGFEEKELRVNEYNEYVFKDVANCDSLWLKECTDDEDLVSRLVIKTKAGKEIEVIGYKDETFSDDYDAAPTKAWQEKEAREAEIKKQQEEQRKEERDKLNENK